MKAFIEFPDNLYDTYKNIEEYNPNQKSKGLIAFDDIIADIKSNERLIK